jgi:glycosyltransferase involved in cell wall biosynthesis
MPVRILHINGERTWRGGERQTLLTVVEQRRLGLDSRLACRRGAPLQAAALAQGVPVIPLPASAPARLVKLAMLVGRFDLVHCHTAKAHSLATLAMLGRRTPLVVTRRVDFLPRNSWFNRYKYGRADRVVCVSRYIADQLREWGVLPGALAVIHDAVPDEERYSRQASLGLLRERANLPEGRRVVGNIAALVWHKDHATLLRAARELVAREPDVAVVVVGDGNLRDELLQLRAQLGLQDSVFFAGFIPQAQRLLSAFDVFAMSSCMEGLGSIVLDAGLAGVPVAATSAGGLPEIVSNEETGLLVPVGDFRALADAISRLLHDGDLARRLAQAAGSQARERFAPSRMARLYADLYHGVLGESPAAGAVHARAAPVPARGTPAPRPAADDLTQ